MGNELLQFEQLLGVYKVRKSHLEKVRHWFPIVPSSKLAGLVAALLSDGHIDWNTYDGNPRPKKLLLYSNYPKECAWFLDSVFELFGIRGRVVRYHSTKGYSVQDAYKAIVYCAELARVLVLLGVPAGDKTTKSYLVPGWIMNGPPEIKAEFLKILFNFDGSISLRTRRETSIEMNYSLNKQEEHVPNGEQFLSQIKELLSQFGIISGRIHIRHCAKDKYTLMLFITNNHSVLNYHEHIGFLNYEKKQRLETAVMRINKHRRVDSGADILKKLKTKMGTDKTAVAKINEISKVQYTQRQFEHMRRGESLIPVDMLDAAMKLLNEGTIDRY